MKGIVFAEFLEMVEDQFGFEVADDIVTNSDLPSGGAYTAVGAYDHQEMVTLVSNLSQKTDIAVPDLLKAFGKYLFNRFTVGYGAFFKDVPSAMDFLSGIENHIHVEVKKLYPDAELPRFEIHRPDSNQMEMVYRSERGLADLAEGLLNGCIEYFDESISLHREDIQGTFETRFSLIKS